MFQLEKKKKIKNCYTIKTDPLHLLHERKITRATWIMTHFPAHSEYYTSEFIMVNDDI